MRYSNYVNGFTLIEVLIATVIIAIALTAVLNTTQTATHDIDYLEDKSIAHWVAMNILNESLGQDIANNNSDESQTKQGDTKMLDRKWQWHTHINNDAFPDVQEVIVTVNRKDRTDILSELHGYRFVNRKKSEQQHGY